MSVYYKVRKGSQAHKILEEFSSKRAEALDGIAKAVREFGSDSDGYLKLSNGGLAGVHFSKRPEGWKKVRGYRGYYMPYANNKEAWGKIPSMIGLESSDIAVLLFDKCPTRYEIMSFFSGVGYIQRSGVFYLSHCDSDVAPIAKGITRIAKSKYIKETEEQIDDLLRMEFICPDCSLDPCECYV